MSHTKGVTARTAHPCSTCDHPTVNNNWTASIRPGHRYLQHVAFPGDDGFEDSMRPWRAKECASCAIGRDDFTAHQFGICGTYCCGDRPCVLPYEKAGAGHEHDHACRGCVSDRVEVSA